MFRNKKKIYLVNRDFQFRYTRAAIIVAIISTFLTAVVILYPLYVFEILRIPKFLPLPILAAMFLAVGLNAALIGMLGLLITHRLAGPIYALTREFRRISEGLWGNTLKIRNDDDMKYLVRCFNEMSESIAKQADQDLNDLSAVERFLTEPEVDVGQAVEKLQSLRKNLKERILTSEESVDLT